MKKYLLIIAALALFTPNVKAQDWLESLKGAASTVADKLTGGKVTEYGMVGSWSYDRPAVKLESENTLTEVAASAATEKLQSALETGYSLVGFKPGSCDCTFTKEGKFTMTAGSHTLEGDYTFENETHALTMTFSSKLLSKLGKIEGVAYRDGTDLQILFPADKILAILQELGSKTASFSKSIASITTLLNAFDGLNLGFEFTRIK